MSIKVCYGHYGQFTILFSETFKGKISIHFLFRNIHLLHSLSFEKIVPISNIYIIKKGAHINFAMGAILDRYATATTQTSN